MMRRLKARRNRHRMSVARKRVVRVLHSEMLERRGQAAMRSFNNLLDERSFGSTSRSLYREVVEEYWDATPTTKTREQTCGIAGETR